MPKPAAQEILDAIRNAAQQLGRPPSKAEFKSKSGMTEYQILQHFPSWREAVRAAGLTPDSTNIRLDDDSLLQDWGELVRRTRRIPTRVQYRREGNFSPGVFERHFGPWSAIPGKFSEFAQNKPEWADVLPLLPPSAPDRRRVDALAIPDETPEGAASASALRPRHAKLEDRPTYGNPIDFRGLRHEPVNEQGVVFLFGMVARELGYMVEAVQAGFPDCEAKRQVGPDKWQRVRIEFEFESRNFRDHGHPENECDVIVCWRHNWPECPSHIEVVALERVIESLAKSED
jgi:hypothetical protein